jgi:DNA-binding PadR family transcriptional regulator
MLENIILGFLYGWSLTGYEIKKVMVVSTSNFIDASYGSLYPALKRLEYKGYIICNSDNSSNRNKKRYSITNEGKTKFLSWLEEPVKFSPHNYEYLSKLFFYGYLEKEKLPVLISSFTDSVSIEISKLDKIEQDYLNEMDPFAHKTLLFGKEYYNLIIKWHKELLNEIEVLKQEKKL